MEFTNQTFYLRFAIHDMSSRLRANAWRLTQGDNGNHTLAELFAKVPFHYSLDSDEEELSTYMVYKELVSNYERTRRITPNQHVELVTILEKRLARGSRVQSDYFESKRGDSMSSRTWESAMMRVITVVSTAREAIRMSRSYGNPDLVYSFPSTAVPRFARRIRLVQKHSSSSYLIGRTPSSCSSLPLVWKP